MLEGGSNGPGFLSRAGKSATKTQTCIEKARPEISLGNPSEDLDSNPIGFGSCALSGCDGGITGAGSHSEDPRLMLHEAPLCAFRDALWQGRDGRRECRRRWKEIF